MGEICPCPPILASRSRGEYASSETLPSSIVFERERRPSILSSSIRFDLLGDSADRFEGRRKLLDVMPRDMVPSRCVSGDTVREIELAVWPASNSTLSPVSSSCGPSEGVEVCELLLKGSCGVDELESWPVFSLLLLDVCGIDKPGDTTSLSSEASEAFFLSCCWSGNGFL